MKIERKQIFSNSNNNDPRPWVDISETGGVVRGGERANFKGKQLTKVKNRDLLTPGQIQASVASAGNSDDVVWDFAITLEGDVVFEPAGTRAEYSAHLGWYNKETDTLELLNFVEDRGL